MNYAGLRPEGAIDLRADDVVLPSQVWNDECQQWQDPSDDKDCASCTCGTRRPTQEATGPMTELSAGAGS
jgi:hypothetical protein